jgi:hypothetical protein
MPMDLCLGKTRSISCLHLSIFSPICAYIEVYGCHHGHEALFQLKVFIFKEQSVHGCQ